MNQVLPKLSSCNSIVCLFLRRTVIYTCLFILWIKVIVLNSYSTFCAVERTDDIIKMRPTITHIKIVGFMFGPRKLFALLYFNQTKCKSIGKYSQHRWQFCCHETTAWLDFRAAPYFYNNRVTDFLFDMEDVVKPTDFWFITHGENRKHNVLILIWGLPEERVGFIHQLLS